MKTHLIYATSNSGKKKEIGRHFGFYDIPVLLLSDFVKVDLDPDETGTTLGQNALIKAGAYAQTISETPSMRGDRFIVISDDTGVFIHALNGEPGIHVRRWIGRKMTDEEIINYTLHRLEGVPEAKRTAHFRTSLCMISVDGSGQIGKAIQTEGMLDGRILMNADPNRTEGFPFESLFYSTEHNMVLGDLHRLSDTEKRAGKFNHRERAIEKALPLIRDMMN